MGLLVWGEKNRLCLTVGRADLWDHRGGMIWNEKQSFEAISRVLRSAAPEKIRELFPVSCENPETPSILPCSRIVITLPHNCLLEEFRLEMDSGTLKILCNTPEGERGLTLLLGTEHENAFALSGVPENSTFDVIPAWEISTSLKERGIAAPVKYAAGFTQTLPADEAFSLECRLSNGELQGAFSRGKSAVLFCAMALLEAESRNWWQKFWKNAPRILTGNPALQEQYCLGLYKFGASCCHGKVPPGLQGPWIEDDALPPWGSDYHFNINVQMFYMGAFKAGQSRALLPLFRLLASWKETLEHNARCFTGEEQGFMLPHAVDDRCRCMGNFWSGAVDHGCTVWMAQMIFEYVRYTGDLAFLKEFGFDFMKRTMAVSRKMLSRDGQNNLQMSLSVSPEYRSQAPDAWGVNASFQLAALHRLARDLIKAAELLGEKKDPFWEEIETSLPQAALCSTPDGEEIALWEGTLLEESHRHHSHLAGIFPFDTLDISSPRWKRILDNTLKRWSEKGMGTWTGWALAWASMLHSRLSNPVMAEFCLDLQRKFFFNSSGASLHDSLNKGFSVIDFGNGREIMQLDAALGAMSAIQDMFFFESKDIFKFFYGIPPQWEKAEFANFSAPGNITVSGRMESGRTAELCFSAPCACCFRLTVPDSDLFFADGTVFKTIELTPGTLCRLTPGKEEFL